MKDTMRTEDAGEAQARQPLTAVERRVSEMPQKMDVHGLFIDPETITDLYLQKRIAVS